MSSAVEYVIEGGKVVKKQHGIQTDAIENISVNGKPQTVTDKSVNITFLEYTEEEKEKLAAIQKPMQIVGRVDTKDDLPTEANNGDVYLVGLEGSESFEEFVCIESYSDSITWESLGKTTVETPDWNQNDKTKNNYIENRIAYKKDPVTKTYEDEDHNLGTVTLNSSEWSLDNTLNLYKYSKPIEGINLHKGLTYNLSGNLHNINDGFNCSLVTYYYYYNGLLSYVNVSSNEDIIKIFDYDTVTMSYGTKTCTCSKKTGSSVSSKGAFTYECFGGHLDSAGDKSRYKYDYYTTPFFFEDGNDIGLEKVVYEDGTIYYFIRENYKSNDSSYSLGFSSITFTYNESDTYTFSHLFSDSDYNSYCHVYNEISDSSEISIVEEMFNNGEIKVKYGDDIYILKDKKTLDNYEYYGGTMIKHTYYSSSSTTSTDYIVEYGDDRVCIYKDTTTSKYYISVPYLDIFSVSVLKYRDEDFNFSKECKLIDVSYDDDSDHTEVIVQEDNEFATLYSVSEEDNTYLYTEDINFETITLDIKQSAGSQTIQEYKKIDQTLENISDFGQSDKNGVGYIKNKTHFKYDNIKEHVYEPEEKISDGFYEAIEKSEGEYYYSKEDGNDIYDIELVSKNSEQIELISGKKYDITYINKQAKQEFTFDDENLSEKYYEESGSWVGKYSTINYTEQTSNFDTYWTSLLSAEKVSVDSFDLSLIDLPVVKVHVDTDDNETPYICIGATYNETEDDFDFSTYDLSVVIFKESSDYKIVVIYNGVYMSNDNVTLQIKISDDVTYSNTEEHTLSSYKSCENVYDAYEYIPSNYLYSYYRYKEKANISINGKNYELSVNYIDGDNENYYVVSLGGKFNYYGCAVEFDEGVEFCIILTNVNDEYDATQDTYLPFCVEFISVNGFLKEGDDIDLKILDNISDFDYNFTLGTEDNELFSKGEYEELDLTVATEYDYLGNTSYLLENIILYNDYYSIDVELNGVLYKDVDVNKWQITEEYTFILIGANTSGESIDWSKYNFMFLLGTVESPAIYLQNNTSSVENIFKMTLHYNFGEKTITTKCKNDLIVDDISFNYLSIGNNQKIVCCGAITEYYNIVESQYPIYNYVEIKSIVKCAVDEYVVSSKIKQLDSCFIPTIDFNGDKISNKTGYYEKQFGNIFPDDIENEESVYSYYIGKYLSDLTCLYDISIDLQTGFVLLKLIGLSYSVLNCKIYKISDNDISTTDAGNFVYASFNQHETSNTIKELQDENYIGIQSMNDGDIDYIYSFTPMLFIVHDTATIQKGTTLTNMITLYYGTSCATILTQDISLTKGIYLFDVETDMYGLTDGDAIHGNFLCNYGSIVPLNEDLYGPKYNLYTDEQSSIYINPNETVDLIDAKLSNNYIYLNTNSNTSTSYEYTLYFTADFDGVLYVQYNGGDKITNWIGDNEVESGNKYVLSVQNGVAVLGLIETKS